MGERRLRTAGRVASAVAAALLVSCGGGGGGGAAGGGGGGGPTIAGNFFPLDSGARWFYAAAGEASAVRVVGAATAAGQAGTLVETVDESGGSVLDQSVYVVAADGVRQYATSIADPISQALDGMQVLRYPLRAGDSYSQVDTVVGLGQDLDGDGRAEQLELSVDMTVVGLETVTTAAGTFAGALHQRQVVRESVKPTGGSDRVTVTITLDTWYAPEVGPVQSAIRIAGAGLDETVQETLTAYGVGSRRSETVAPTVQSVTPGSAVRPPSAIVSATFSEDPDRRTVTALAFTLRDGAGVLVPGTVSLQARTATFAPQAGLLASGNYTATIDGVEDRVGNPMAAPRSWTFVVDDLAPGVVASVPAAGAVDVAASTSIVIDFNEALDPATINGATVTLTDEFGAVQGATLALASTRLTVTPLAFLFSGGTYRVTLRGVTDVLGNPMADFTLSFRTSQGLFRFPVELIPGAAAYTTALGDVDGDGLADVVVSTLPESPAPYRLGVFLLAGRPDGTLAAPLRIDVGPAFAGLCPPESIAVGDVDGDGRNDVVLGSYTCGVQVLRQSAAGVLSPAEHFAPGVSRLRLADVDGDGKLDLLGTDAATLWVWKRGAGGALVASSSTVLGAYGGPDFDVGDLDGDGRPDLAFRVTSNLAGLDVSVVRQQSDGSFAGHALFSSGSAYGVNGVAVGDVTGDGRADVVVAAVDRVVAWRQGSGGTLIATLLPTLINATAVALADMNNDGLVDVVVTHPGEARVGLYYQQGGSLLPERAFVAPLPAVGAIQPMALGDATGDGLRDIVVHGALIRQNPAGGMAALASVGPIPRGGGRAHAGVPGRHAVATGRARMTSVLATRAGR